MNKRKMKTKLEFQIIFFHFFVFKDEREGHITSLISMPGSEQCNRPKALAYILRSAQFFENSLWNLLRNLYENALRAFVNKRHLDGKVGAGRWDPFRI